MRKIKYLENNQDKELNFDTNETPNIVEFNSNLRNKKTEELKSFSVQSKGKNVNVNLENGDITIDGNKIELDLDDETKAKLNINNLRWINFHRVRVSYRMSGLKSHKSVGYGMGWQADVGGKTIKRFVLVTDEGHSLETE